MPMRRNLVQCSLLYDTTISNIYALNDTFNGSGNTGSFTGTAGTTLANPSGNELEVSSTTVYPVISSTISTTTGKEYIVSADLNGMTSSPGYTASVLCEVIESGVTVASQSTTAPGNFNFTYTAGAGSASVRYTFVLTPNPGPPPPPPMAPFSFNLDNALVYFIDTAISSETVCVSKNGYRYGFNGKRIDENEEGMGGGGSTYDYGFRIYNPNLGKFLSLDPLNKIFPFYSPYHFAGNMPLIAIDLDGLEPLYMINANGELTLPMIKLLSTLFNYDEDILTDSRWKESKMKLVTKNTNAITLFKKIFYSMEIDRTDDEFWVNLISHEEKHRQELGNNILYQVLWYINYGISYLFYLSYDENPPEVRAKSIESVMESFMEKYSSITLYILKNDNYTEKEKAGAIYRVAIKFKAEYLVEKLNNLNLKLEELKSNNSSRRKIRKVEKEIERTNKELNEVQNKVNYINEQEIKWQNTA